MAIRCPICRDNGKIVLMESRLNIYGCGSCAHIFTVAPKERQEKYDDDYFLKTHKAWFDNPNYGLFDFVHKEARKLLGEEPLRLLDVGCGKGDFLKYISKRDSDARLFGIDLVYNQYPGIRFIEGDLYDLKKEDLGLELNVICGFAVIEHVDDPHLFAQKLNSLLRPDGLLFIMTVNSSSLIYRIAGFLNKAGAHTAYDRLYSIHHLHHYTNRSLRKLMDMNGFDILFMKNHNYPMKAVDLPESGFLMKKMYKFFVWVIFLLSSAFGCGIYQTIACRKKGPIQNPALT